MRYVWDEVMMVVLSLSKSGSSGDSSRSIDGMISSSPRSAQTVGSSVNVNVNGDAGGRRGASLPFEVVVFLGGIIAMLSCYAAEEEGDVQEQIRHGVWLADGSWKLPHAYSTFADELVAEVFVGRKS